LKDRGRSERPLKTIKGMSALRKDEMWGQIGSCNCARKKGRSQSGEANKKESHLKDKDKNRF